MKCASCLLCYHPQFLFRFDSFRLRHSGLERGKSWQGSLRPKANQNLSANSLLLCLLDIHLSGTQGNFYWNSFFNIIIELVRSETGVVETKVQFVNCLPCPTTRLPSAQLHPTVASNMPMRQQASSASCHPAGINFQHALFVPWELKLLLGQLGQMWVAYKVCNRNSVYCRGFVGMNVLVTLRQARQVRFLLLFNLLLPEVISGFCVLHGREFTAILVTPNMWEEAVERLDHCHAWPVVVLTANVCSSGSAKSARFRTTRVQVNTESSWHFLSKGFNMLQCNPCIFQCSCRPDLLASLTLLCTCLFFQLSLLSQHSQQWWTWILERACYCSFSQIPTTFDRSRCAKDCTEFSNSSFTQASLSRQLELSSLWNSRKVLSTPKWLGWPKWLSP